MRNDLIFDSQEYRNWLSELKTRARQLQYKSAIALNRELLEFYWQFGADIVEKQESTIWGDGFIKQLSRDLMAEFPGIKGFSVRNIKYVRQWYLFYSDATSIGQQPVAQITQIPWGHNLAIIAKCKSIDEATYYVENTICNGWSRSVLVHQIETGLWQREGQALSNFAKALPSPQSDLAIQTLKDPYVFDFLTLTRNHNERELEQGLIQHITNFLLELGAGFAYIGKQIPLQVGEQDFFLDLLFYHTRLHCYVVVELKVVDFEPEHIGKLNFYLKAVDAQLSHPGDQPSIGILLCKSRDRMVVEYALSNVHKPIGVSEYKITKSLPAEFQSSLPSVEEIEAEFTRDIIDEQEWSVD